VLWIQERTISDCRRGPGIRLDFQGPDAERFEQVNSPTNPHRTVKVVAIVKYLLTKFPGFLPNVN
jgi:hypothetical protein